MKKQILFLGALCAVLVAGCNGSDPAAATAGGKTGVGAGTNAGACTMAEQHICSEVRYSGTATAEQVGNATQQGCVQEGGTYSQSCAGGALGGCNLSETKNGVTATQSNYYYPSDEVKTVDVVKQTCAYMKGEFFAP